MSSHVNVILATGYLATCLVIEYGTSSPKLLAWLSPDPKTNKMSDAVSAATATANDPEDDEDEDVAVEAKRVEIMEEEGVLGGEVVLNKLRKVYRTQQASLWDLSPQVRGSQPLRATVLPLTPQSFPPNCCLVCGF